jgi:AcrR family transcriptional regulator
VAQTLELMRTRGLGRLTMSELATALGVKRPTLYFYFRDLSGLLLAAVEEVYRAYAVHIAARLAPIDHPVEALGELARATVAYQRERRDLVILLFQLWAAGDAEPELLLARSRAAGQVLRADLVARVRAGVERGVVAPCDPERHRRPGADRARRHDRRSGHRQRRAGGRRRGAVAAGAGAADRPPAVAPLGAAPVPPNPSVARSPMTPVPRPLWIARVAGTQAEMGRQHGALLAATGGADATIEHYRDLPGQMLAGDVPAPLRPAARVAIRGAAELLLARLEAARPPALVERSRAFLAATGRPAAWSRYLAVMDLFQNVVGVAARLGVGRFARPARAARRRSRRSRRARRRSSGARRPPTARSATRATSTSPASACGTRRRRWWCVTRPAASVTRSSRRAAATRRW